MGFRVTAEEQAMIRKKMAMTGITNLRTYLLKSAINGYVVNVDLSEIRECNRLLRNVSNNVNQIARRIHQTGGMFASDINDIKAGLNEIWKKQDRIIKSFGKFAGSV